MSNLENKKQVVFRFATEEDTGLIVSKPEVLSDIANKLFQNMKNED